MPPNEKKPTVKQMQKELSARDQSLSEMTEAVHNTYILLMENMRLRAELEQYQWTLSKLKGFLEEWPDKEPQFAPTPDDFTVYLEKESAKEMDDSRSPEDKAKDLGIQL